MKIIPNAANSITLEAENGSYVISDNGDLGLSIREVNSMRLEIISPKPGTMLIEHEHQGYSVQIRKLY